jgi:hypothetical protein
MSGIPRTFGPRPSWLWLVAMFLVASCVAPAGGVPSLAAPTEATTPTPQTSASLPIDRTDPRFAKCGGTAGPVIATFPMAAAHDYRLHFPAIGRAPELDGSSSPAFVVVFAGM